MVSCGNVERRGGWGSERGRGRATRETSGQAGSRESTSATTPEMAVFREHQRKSKERQLRSRRARHGVRTGALSKARAFRLADLLILRAVHLQRENDWVWRRPPAILGDCAQGAQQRDVGGEGVAVVDLGLAVGAVEAIQLDAPAAHQ
eukprot:scaffold17457_cov105-Isochrysis_galbana.AAC.8